MLKKILKFAEHNSGICIGVILCSIILIWAYGCPSKVPSITNPSVRVTREQLFADVNDYLARAELAFRDLERQDLIKGTIFNHALDLITAGRIDPYSLMAVLGNILGLGAIIDNVRKRTLIATLKHNANKT